MTFQIIQIFLRLITTILAEVKIEGLEKIRNSGASIVAANHVGRLEVFLLYAYIPRTDIIVIVAEKYKKYAIVRWLGKRLDVIFVERFNGDLNTVRIILKRLEQNMIFVVAPEGTRSKTGGLIPARKGAAYIASKSGVPVFPACIVGSDDKKVLNNIKRFRRSEVIIRVGDAFTLPPLPKSDRDEALQQYTDEIMCQIAALLPPAYRGVYANNPRLLEILKHSDEITGI